MLTTLYNFFMPSCCLICNGDVLQTNSSTYSQICIECFAKLNWLTHPRCIQCGTQFQHDLLQNDICLNCSLEKWDFDKLFACTEYNDISSKIAMKLKYKGIGAAYIAKCIAHILPNNIDYIIPTPLFWSRIFKRGYNQSFLIAKEISKLINKPCCNNLLIRQYATQSQGGLTRIERMKNIKSAFCINPKMPTQEKQLFNNKTILLIDDVVTTGATIQACSLALKKEINCNIYIGAWAKRIY